MREVAPGEPIAEQAEVAANFHLLLEGTAQALVIEDGRTEPVGDHVAPTWVGAIAALTAAPLGVGMVALTPMRVTDIPAEQFLELAVAHRPVFQQVMAQVRPVMGRITSMEQNRERLASLGTMAAGLAHELNNPAAAARRAAAELADALEVLGSTIGQVAGHAAVDDIGEMSLEDAAGLLLGVALFGLSGSGQALAVTHAHRPRVEVDVAQPQPGECPQSHALMRTNSPTPPLNESRNASIT